MKSNKKETKNRKKQQKNQRFYPQLQIQSSSQQEQEQEQEQEQILCCGSTKKKSNQATYFCGDENCTYQKIFICNQSSCKCNNTHHKKCSKFHILYVLDQFENRLKNTQQLKENIQNQFTIIRQKINKMEKQIYQTIQEDLNGIKLTQTQKLFYFISTKAINQSQYKLNGKLMHRMLLDLAKNKNLNQVSVEYHIKQLQKLVKNLECQIDRSHLNICKFVQTIQVDNTKKLKITGSSIIKQRSNDTDKILQFFPKKVKSIDLVFIASENNFDIKKYYQKCGAIKNSLIICQTYYGKIIGGFTPLAFNPVDRIQNKSVTDNTNSSFVFSLTQNDKFILKNKSNAIYRHANKQFINFGGSILLICDKANIQDKCSTYLGGTSYHNFKYKYNTQSYQRMNGTMDHNFRVRQWEVYQIQFK